MCSEWGLLALARRTYSEYLPPATIRCNFCCTFDMLPHKWGPRRKYSRTLSDILAPISGNFLAKGLRPLFCRV